MEEEFDEKDEDIEEAEEEEEFDEDWFFLLAWTIAYLTKITFVVDYLGIFKIKTLFA